MAVLAVGLFLLLIIFLILFSPFGDTGLYIPATGDCANTLGEFLEFDLDFLLVDFLKLPIDFIDSLGENIP
jgi:hypothetical protein